MRNCKVLEAITVNTVFQCFWSVVVTTDKSANILYLHNFAEMPDIIKF